MQVKTKNMLKASKKIILVGIFLAVFSIKAFCQLGEVSYDNRIKSKLIALGLKYEISDLGNFKVVFEMGDDRTQLVLINSSTNEYGGMEIREITSVAAIAKDKSYFSQKTLYKLLDDNDKWKLGAWQISGDTDNYMLQFSVKISANSTQSVLEEILKLAATIADTKEKELTENDRY
jgi:hypothetical protein